MVIFDTDFVEVTFDKDKELGMIRWKAKCTSEQYQDAFTRLLEIQKTEKISRYISDIRNQAVISPTDRKWFENVAFPKAIEQGLIVGAVVFDGNAFKKYYVNVILAATNKYKLPMKIFNEADEAMAFVMSKSS